MRYDLFQLAFTFLMTQQSRYHRAKLGISALINFHLPSYTISRHFDVKVNGERSSK